MFPKGISCSSSSVFSKVVGGELGGLAQERAELCVVLAVKLGSGIVDPKIRGLTDEGASLECSVAFQGGGCHAKGTVSLWKEERIR